MAGLLLIGCSGLASQDIVQRASVLYQHTDYKGSLAVLEADTKPDAASFSLTGYFTHRASELARPMRRIPSAVLRVTLGGLRQWPVPNEKISLEYKLKRFLEGCLMPPLRAHVYWNGTFSDADKCAILIAPLPPLWAMFLTISSGGRQSRSLFAVRPEIFSSDDILVESRSPEHGATRLRCGRRIWITAIVEFAASLPQDLRIRDSRQKVLLKELFDFRII